MALTASQQAYLRTKGALTHGGGASDPAGTGLTPGQSSAGSDGGIYQVGNRVFSTNVAGWREAMCLSLSIS